MLELKNPKIAVPVVLFAGILWSFGPLVVRYMDNPNQVPWQYIFGRGLTIFIILNLYLYFEEGINFWKNYLKIGKSGVLGGFRPWNCNDFFYLLYNKYFCSNNLIMFSCNAFLYSTFSIYFLKKKFL